MKLFLVKYARVLLGLLGLGAIVFLVRKVGADAVWTTMREAGIWLPLILLLDFSWMAVEGLALLFVYGPEREKIRPREWLRASLTHFATFVFVPVGRASAEVARAAVLAPWVGKSRATAGAAVMQAMTLSANGVMSALCLLAVLLTVKNEGVSALIGINMLVTGGLGIALYSVLRHVKVGGFLGKRFERLAQLGPEVDVVVQQTRADHSKMLFFTVFGRCIQTAQYAVILYAVVGTSSVAAGLVAEGIQLAGRSAGDAVPGAVGVVETAFTLSAAALSLGEHTDKAISIALLGRVSSISVAAICALLLQVIPTEGEVASPDPASE